MMDLSKLKPLTTDQYDRARRKALERVQQRIGVKPKRADFHREMGSIFTPLDALPVPDALRTAYIQAHAKARAFEQRYCQLLEDIARAQAERARKQRQPAPLIVLPAPELPTPAGLGWQPIWEFTFNGDRVA